MEIPLPGVSVHVGLVAGVSIGTPIREPLKDHKGRIIAERIIGYQSPETFLEDCSDGR